MSFRFRAIFALAALSLIGASHVALAQSKSPEETLLASVKDGPMEKLGPWLGNLYEEFRQATNKEGFQTRNPALRVRGGRVAVNLYAKDAAALQAALATLGATSVTVQGPLVSAQVPVRALADLAALPSLEFGDPVLAAVRVASQGTVVSQGDVSLRSDTARAVEGVDGSGVTVGVLSDSYRCNPPAFLPGAPSSTAAQDELAAEVPVGVQVLSNGPCPGSDEGRAMVQLVHDVAPGAAQKFHTAFNGVLDFANGILRLRNAGANVIVDDVIYFAENMFSDGIIAQAADRAVAQGAAYFSSAGNDARLSYESAYREMNVASGGGGSLNSNDGPFVLRAHNFGSAAAADTVQKISVTQSGGQAVILFSFQWDQPFLSSTTYAHLTDPTATSRPRGATGDLDMLIYDDHGVLVPLCPPGLSVGITCQLTGTRNLGRDAVDIAALVVTGPKTKTGEFFVRFVRAGGTAPQHVKYVAFELAGTLDIVEHDTASGTAYGHSNARNVASVGAASWYLTDAFDAYFSTLVQDTPGACRPACLNVFSSAGGIPIYLDKYGVRLASADQRPNPRFTGPDGGNTTFFFADSSFDDDDNDGRNSPISTFITKELDKPADELPNFFGTSASAPHVAGVAALMLQKNSRLLPQQVYSILISTAKDMTRREVEVVPGLGESVFSAIGAGYDFDAGAGFVDAAAAITAVPKKK
jgi:subtilisin family serine protease